MAYKTKLERTMTYQTKSHYLHHFLYTMYLLVLEQRYNPQNDALISIKKRMRHIRENEVARYMIVSHCQL